MGKFVKFAVAGVILLVIYIVFSTAGLRRMEAWARERPDTSVGQSLPYTLGNLAYFTFRYSVCKDIFEENVATWPNHPKNASAYFRIAMALEKMGQYGESVAAYEAFALRYPNDPRADSALSRAGKIKAVQLDDPFGG